MRTRHLLPLIATTALLLSLWACGSDDEGGGGSGASSQGGTTSSGSGGNAGGANGGGGSGGLGGSGGSTPATPDCPDVGLNPAEGTIHYVCECGVGSDSGCQPGDDGNDGLSPDTPWQSYEQARSSFGSLAAGDTIAFCQGGGFDAQGGGRWVNPNCLADDPCVVRDYEPPWSAGGLERPILHLAADANAFALEDGGDADHEEGYIIMNLILRGAGSGQGVFVYNDVDDVLLCNLEIDSFRLGVHVAGSNPPAAGSDGINERIVLRSSRVIDNGGQGWLGACNGCAVEYTELHNNGFDEAVFNHNIYFSGSSGGIAQGMRAVGNDLYRSAIVGGACAGVSLVVHGEHDGLVIEGNTVREDVGAAGNGCWGIAIDTGYNEAEAFRNVVVRGNTVIDVGNVGIGLNACENCLVENNVIVHTQSFNTRAIAIPDRDRDPNDLPMTGVTVRNNSIYIGADAGGAGLLVGGEGSGHVVVSNAIHYPGSSGGWSCMILDLDLSAYDAVDNNLCHFPDSGGEWVDGQGDLASWNAASGFDGSSLAADPLFGAPSASPWDLSAASATSPMVNAGHPSLSASNAHDGGPRDGQPDIGAHEW